MSAAEPQRATCNCESHAAPGFLISGYRQDGEKWTCPNCGQIWHHVCDEEDGCSWVPGRAKESR